MFASYLTIALRNLRKDRVYAAINILGLAIGLTCCLLIFLYVKGELAYDRYHAKADRIYRVVSDIINDSETNHNSQCAAPVGPHLKTDFPEVLQVVRTAYASFLLQYKEQKFQEDQVLAADASLFEVFDFPLKAGNPKQPL
jgi:putative ABC transport system permease protein